MSRVQLATLVYLILLVMAGCGSQTLASESKATLAPIPTLHAAEEPEAEVPVTAAAGPDPEITRCITALVFAAITHRHSASVEVDASSLGGTYGPSKLTGFALVQKPKFVEGAPIGMLTWTSELQPEELLERHCTGLVDIELLQGIQQEINGR